MNMFQPRNSFASNHVTITPDDDHDLDTGMVIYCGSDGDIAVEDKDGVAVIYTVTAGDILPVVVHRVLEAGTTVTQIIGLY